MNEITQSYKFNSYLSEFSWRFGSDAMRHIWSEEHRRLLWRRVWLALASAQHELGLVTQQELEDIEKHSNELNMERSLTLRSEMHHEINAELKAFSEQAIIGGNKIHLGATSSDIEDNADILRISEAFAIIKKELVTVLKLCGAYAVKYSDLLVPGRTHLQIASPTTLGYRFCLWAQDFWTDLEELENVRSHLLAKGFRGSVGTSASYNELLLESSLATAKMEKIALKKLGLKAFEITSQTYPRKQDLRVINLLSNIAQSAYKFALDIRILQSSGIDEVKEWFGLNQVGSSAMPHKKNPAACEKICSLSRILSTTPNIFWQNAANSALERTLDDSANRRILLGESFLLTEEILVTTAEILSRINVDRDRIVKNFNEYILQLSSERLLNALLIRGMNRVDAYKSIQGLASTSGDLQSIIDTVYSQDKIADTLSKKEIQDVFEIPKSDLISYRCNKFSSRLLKYLERLVD